MDKTMPVWALTETMDIINSYGYAFEWHY